MSYWVCEKCGDCRLWWRCGGRSVIRDPKAPWWWFWGCWITCPACGGDGHAKPPGWPDRVAECKPSPPPPPPRKRASDELHAAFLALEKKLNGEQ